MDNQATVLPYIQPTITTWNKISNVLIANELVGLKHMKQDEEFDNFVKKYISDDDSYVPGEITCSSDDEKNSSTRHQKKTSKAKNKKPCKIPLGSKFGLTKKKPSAFSDLRSNHHGETYTPRDASGQFPCAHSCGKVFEYAAPCRIHSRFCKSRPQNWNEFDHFKKM